MCTVCDDDDNGNNNNNNKQLAHPLDTLALPPIIKTTKKQTPFSNHRTLYIITSCYNGAGFIHKS